MQVNSAVRPTCGRQVVITGYQVDAAGGHRVDKAADYAANNKAGQGVPKITLVDKVMNCLENEETVTEQLLGYALCALALLYLLGSLARAVIAG